MESNTHITRLLTVRQACEHAACSRTALNSLIRAGRIRTVRIGTRGIRIPIAELDRFVAEQLGGGAY